MSGEAQSGAAQALAAGDPGVQAAAAFAVQQLAAQSNSLVPPELKEVRAWGLGDSSRICGSRVWWRPRATP